MVLNQEVDDNYNPTTTYEDVKENICGADMRNQPIGRHIIDGWIVMTQSWSLTKIEDKGDGVKYYWYRKKIN